MKWTSLVVSPESSHTELILLALNSKGEIWTYFPPKQEWRRLPDPSEG